MVLVLQKACGTCSALGFGITKEIGKKMLRFVQNVEMLESKAACEDTTRGDVQDQDLLLSPPSSRCHTATLSKVSRTAGNLPTTSDLQLCFNLSAGFQRETLPFCRSIRASPVKERAARATT